jgi:hypothetical protein
LKTRRVRNAKRLKQSLYVVPAIRVKYALKGKDSSGKLAWIDVFAKRDGKWMAVRSQNAMVK